MVRGMCGMHLFDRKRTEDLEMLGLEESVEWLARANRVQSCGHVLRRNGEHVLRKVLWFEVNGPQKQGRPRKTRREQWRRVEGSV